MTDTPYLPAVYNLHGIANPAIAIALGLAHRYFFGEVDPPSVSATFFFGEDAPPTAPPTFQEATPDTWTHEAESWVTRYAGDVGPLYTKSGRTQIDPNVASYDSFHYPFGETRLHKKQPLQVFLTYPPAG